MGDIIELKVPEKTLSHKLRDRGQIVKKRLSKNLYVDFYYRNDRIVKSLGLRDTPDNRMWAEKWLDNVIRKIDDGTFRFADAFPGASEAEKAHFAKLEGWDYTPEAGELTIGEYIKSYRQRFLSDSAPSGKKRDWNQILDYWIVPTFGEMMFSEINGVVLEDFIENKLCHADGKKKGQRLSASRIANILIPFRAIWDAAMEEKKFQLPDPFSYLRKKKKVPRRGKNRPVVFRFSEFMRVLEKIDPYYRLHTEMQIVTGLIGSELAGLRKCDITEKYLLVRNSIVRNEEKGELKTENRNRRIKITGKIRELIATANDRAQGDYLFTMKSGRTFDVDSYRKNAWTTAMGAAGMAYRKPYVLRHSFAAWSLTIGIDKNRLVALMGHASKEMVFEVYGEYVEDLETDAGLILNYLGKDYAGLE
jgi:integrase